MIIRFVARKLKRKLLPIVLLICLVPLQLLGGCSTTANVHSWQAQKSRINPHIYVSEADQILFPPQEQTDAIRRTFDKSVKECMSRKGYETQEVSGLLGIEDENSIENVYSFLPEDKAMKYGLAAPGFRESKKTSDLNQTVAKPEGYDKTLFGTESGEYIANSCYGKAISAVFPNLDRTEEIRQVVRNISLEASRLVDAKRIEAEKGWGECMKGKGFGQFKTISGLGSPKGDTNIEEGWPDKLTLPEIKVAQASSKCMIETGYLETVSKAQAIAAHKLIQRKPGLLTEWQKLQKQQYEASKHVS